MNSDDTLGCELTWMIKLLSHAQASGVSGAIAVALYISRVCSVYTHTDCRYTDQETRSSQSGMLFSSGR